MRLLVRMASASTSMRAPAKPFSLNPRVATSMMSAIVLAGSLIRGWVAFAVALRTGGFCVASFRGEWPGSFRATLNKSPAGRAMLRVSHHGPRQAQNAFRRLASGLGILALGGLQRCKSSP